ncbi:uncharacterized protein LOC116201828 isoform X2 [Punica granatum]|uniref:Uncharacterized protein LOC116201828 isoform X2 n=1 Tax=Punica granatum TaxID=22663 RepID=A0A6P8CYF6_PUNGR|nr:uncharacterized protein LOC116201828 isoform X2 [Punica granatum]
MFGGSSKVGRGGGRGGAGGGSKRFPAPPLQPTRPALPSAGRLSLSGGPRNRNTGPAAAAPPSVEETFSLVSGNNPLAFAMIIRLTPDLVEEIRRVEAQGETAKIKFDANPKNPSGNLINVGDKEFRFTWSKEFGDLCDIYEEKKSGEHGNGLLVESGCAWRKLNVQRILDESTTTHVKMLSEEAVRKTKARKAIVLDHGNPVMKSQIKQLAAVEATSNWRMGFKRKEPPPKKRKVDPPHVSSGSLKPAFKPGLSSNPKIAGKGIRAISPIASSPDQFRASASPSAAVNISKTNATTEDAGPSGQLSKEDTTTAEREIPTKPSVMASDRSGHKVDIGSKPMDLQSMLISLLKDNPKGMSIKALEKAIGYTIPNSGKKILSRIATYQAPGRYLLKPGVELEGFKGPSPGSGSSFEDDNNQVPTFEENFDQTPGPEPTFPKEVQPNNGLAQVNSAVQGDLDASENVDIEQHSPDLFGDKKDSNNSDGRADSSSDSGSDSDSGSSSSDSRSDSGSPSRSRSRSRSKSPIGSGSGSSSDSDSDASSNQEGSDEDVDIMTSDDDKELKHNIQDPGPAFPASTPDGGILDIDGIDEKHDGLESDTVDIDVVDEGDYGHGATAEETKHISPGQNRERQNFIGSLFDEEETAYEDNFKQEQSDSSERASRGQTTRAYNSRHSDVNSERVKRLKTENYSQSAVPQGGDGHYSMSPRDLSPGRHNEDLCQSPAGRMPNRVDRDVNTRFSIQKGSQAFSEKPSLHSQQLSRRSHDQGFSGSMTNDISGRPNRQAESWSHGRIPMQKERLVIEAQSEGYGAAERGPRSNKEGSGGKHSVPSDSPYDKSGETAGNNLKNVGQVSSMQIGSSRKDINGAGVERSALVNGRGGAILQREFSGLELGELRPEEAPLKRPFERKGSFKQSEHKSNNSENRSMDPGRRKTPGKLNIDSGKPSTPNLSRKRTTERREDDSTVPVPQGMQSQLQYPTKGDHGDGSAQISKKKEAGSADYGGGLKQRESSSDENSCSYSKYDKDEPDLKGRIKDYSQFEEYVQEYRDKYESYCSINKILENYRNKFQKMGKELEFAKGRDLERYNKALAQLRDSYRRCGVKHKRLKKIFVVLHQELKHLKQMMNEFAQTYSKD